MRRAVTTALMTTICLCAAAVSYAQGEPGPIRWKAEEQGAPLRAAIQQSAADVLEATQDSHVVLQFKRIPNAEQKASLEAQGIFLQRYLGENAWFARVKDGKRAKEIMGQMELASAMKVQRQWKLHPKLARGDFPQYARFSAGRAERSQSKTEAATEPDIVALYVLFHPDVDLDKTATAVVVSHGGVIRSLMRSINGAVVWLPSTNLSALADEDAVEWIEPPLPPMDVSNDSVRTAVQVHTVQEPPFNLDGSGINVMIYDGGTVMAAHSDLEGRVFVRDNSGVADHPTHVAGTLGGSGAASNGFYAGMAPGVIIQSFGFEYDGTGQFLYTNPGDLEADYNRAINTYGVVLTNNSIGTNVAPNGYPCEWEGDYGATDMLIDAIVRGSLGAPMRVIWANGNERGSGRCGVTYHTTAPPACAKNHISVGAYNSNDFSMTTFSSWGPTDDGRIKPDVCAPGCQSSGDNGVTSTVASGGYGVMCGTSMSAPVVTGLAALVLQDWKEQYPMQPLPPNSLLKVLFAHNAEDLGTPGPDYVFGYGAVRILETIQFLRSGSFAQGAIEHGQSLYYFVPVSQVGQRIKVTLAWDDPPGAPNTVPELVNDLDLWVVSPSGITHYPWTLEPSSPESPAVRNKPDRRNNIEQVVVDAPEPGTWSIVIHGYAIPSGPQAFSMACTPELRTCSSAGLVAFAAPSFGCNSSVTVSVKDCDLDTDSTTVQTVTIQVSSSSEPAGESLVLTETSPFSATFEGTLPTSSEDAPGILHVHPGDTVTALYMDASDGRGNYNVPVAKSTLVDCQPPEMTTPTVTAVTASTARIEFHTNEPATVQIRYGTSCDAATKIMASRQFMTVHSITLSELIKDTTYYFIVDVDDEAGNRTTSDNGGACHSFQTLDRQDYYTELFSPSGFDLDGKALTFTPSSSIHRYTACLDSISALPVDPDSLTPEYLSDDSYFEVNLTDGKTFPFYDVAYSKFYVGSNGYVTFVSGDTDYTESLADHFNRPRISVLFDDLNPPSGSVRWRQLPDRVVVAWVNVPEYGTYNSNTFELIMHFDGTIQMAWLGIDSADSLVGLSAGGGVPADFEESDLSAAAPCVGLPAQAFDPRPAHLQADASVVCTLSWQAGWRATSHEVYFGLSPDALELKAVQAEPRYVLPTLLNSTTYYWRVDEVNNEGRTPGNLWTFSTKRLKPDLDQDGDVDMTDFGLLQLCLTGKDVPQTAAECQAAKMDDDDDVDTTDVEILFGCMSGSDVQAIGSCFP
ncbi:MAG TPA: S8 family serine peptidase [Phycisphaerae bacterium]|nr:S8 family serine peptidase [Phycisphaerae bacterium]HOJ73291.1 S8 family serine peptidase [Phycisphaerae bacterium]HOM51143.1 S8 family serine peptidase [Phycisphaerae bacterium]HPP25271.1 S8 family serine peptidase [Phycisphaerae bacterium]